MNDDDPTLPFRRALVREPESMRPFVLEARERPTVIIRRPALDGRGARYATVAMFLLAIGFFVATAIIYLDSAPLPPSATPPLPAVSAIPSGHPRCFEHRGADVRSSPATRSPWSDRVAVFCPRSSSEVEVTGARSKPVTRR